MPSLDRLVLYVNPAWRRQGIHSPFMNSWWGNSIAKESVLAHQLFDAFEFDTSLYTVTDDIAISHVVFAPYSHNWLLHHDKELLEECASVARTMRLPLLIDGSGDIEYPVHFENTYVLRVGGYRFLPEKGRIGVPFLADDLMSHYRGGVFTPRGKSEGKPVVGFAGWAQISKMQFLRTFLKEIPVTLRSMVDGRYGACHKGVLIRRKAIHILQHSQSVFLSSRIRGSFSASQKTAEGDMQELRKEMVAIIENSDYALDVRGDGNGSTRLFEILSLGRIPVIVDTERNFPFADKIDYASFSLIIDFRSIQELPERIAEFHKSLSPERFKQMQQNARQAFVSYFRIDAIMRPLIEELRLNLRRDGNL